MQLKSPRALRRPTRTGLEANASQNPNTLRKSLSCVRQVFEGLFLAHRREKLSK
jgi:hypothetical protein